MWYHDRAEAEAALEITLINLSIKNLPGEVHRALKRRAKVHRRSLNQEIVDILARETEARPMREPLDVEAFLEDLHRLHKRLKWSSMTNAEINAAKREGRP